jgi:hypothetical protein
MVLCFARYSGNIGILEMYAGKVFKVFWRGNLHGPGVLSAVLLSFCQEMVPVTSDENNTGIRTSEVV